LTPAPERTGMEVILAARDERLASAWERACGDMDCVRIHRGSIFDVACDALVSPANSYGFMDGGLDALYSDRFGWDVETRLRRLILDRHGGELLIGTAEIVETGNVAHPFLIAAPTMRVPMVLHTPTVNPFLATRAVLRLARHGVFPPGSALAGEPICQAVRSIAFPGLGTGVGRVPPAICARQMRAALDEFLLDGFREPADWAEASERHQLLYTDRPTRLQY
jgi:O-acetyl-ADP-ribose deacetylase (regulator of RNase III)